MPIRWMARVQGPAVQADVQTEAVLSNRPRRARSAIPTKRDDLIPVMPARVHAQSRTRDDGSLKAILAEGMVLQLMRTSVMTQPDHDSRHPIKASISKT